MNAVTCKHPGCTGRIEDGYCDACGLAESKTPAAALPRSKPGPPLGKASNGSLNGAVVSGASKGGSLAAPSRSASVSTGTGSTPLSRGSHGTPRTRSSSSRSTRRTLGAGLVSVPELPSTEPEKAIMADARVPDNKRFCANCDRQLARDRGFCGQCGQKFSFIPTLQPGDLVAGQYEVKGAIAYGGLGWIYLAFDRLLSRYVVLKGLLNTEDASAAAVAVAERQFLAAVKHPNIVGIYNFVQRDAEGFIVMEYVGGRTLRDIRRARGPLPASEAIAYIHRILGAFVYLHRMNLVYCDFKPENVMLECDDVKLIDLGGVRKIGDLKGDIYGTAGYSAPEAGEGPTVESDLFTVGRTLAVLLTDIKGFSSAHKYTLPGPEEEPLFAQQESLYRFLLKATAENPGDRFESAEQMSDQLLGILREIVAMETGAARPGTSALFGGDMLGLTFSLAYGPVKADYRHLPVPILDAEDAAFSLIVSASGLTEVNARVAGMRQAVQLSPGSSEARLRLANSLTDGGLFDEADRWLKELEGSDPWDWRPRWYRGRLLLAQGDPKGAQAVFDQVYFDLPGEPAPKLAFAMAAELAGNLVVATHMYDLVARTDPSFTSACFGLARCRAAAGDRKGAVEALSRIPQTSSMHTCSRVEVARALISKASAAPGVEELSSASAIVETLPLEGMDRYRLAQCVLETALNLITNRSVPPTPTVRVLGQPLDEFHLRRGLEKSLRAMAHLARDEEKIRLVDEANRVRPRTII